MQCSFPTTQAVVNSMRQQVLTVEDRKLILDRQGALWADDEIAWHLANIQRLCAPCLELTVIDPLLVFGWVHVGFDNFHDWLRQHCPKPCSIATVVYANQHWIPVFLKPMNGTLFAHTWDSQQADHGCLDALFAHLAGHFGLRDHQHIRLVRMFDMDEGCGAMAIAFLAHTALNRMLPNTPYEVEQELAAFLIQQGVPVEQSANRAKSALQAIGAAPIAEALQSRIPWKQLKTLGNQVKYQFLLPSELKAKIAGVAGKTAIGRPKGGKKSKRVPQEEAAVINEYLAWGDVWSIAETHLSTRSVPTGWDPDIARSGRAMVSAGQETAQYRQMWAVIEETASRASPVPIDKASRGRAQTLKPRKVVGHAHAPLRAPRAGDVQPSYFGISLKHAHWYRQVRRLQAFVRFVKVRRPTADPSHAGSTWGAIKRAKGFEPSFADWWRHSTTRVHGAPAELPEHPPDHGVAQTIYDTCLLALRKLELDLRRSSRAHAKARRLANPQLIFQDIRVPGPESLDLLICPTQAKVIHVDADMGCIQVDASRAWDLTHPVYVDGHPYDVVHHEEDWLWLDPMNQLSIGNVCTQVKFTGALEDLFAEFQTTWSKRWDRHKHVPESQWNDIFQFAQKFARPIQCVSGPMTEADVRAELRRKKTRTAKGLDGVSLADLKHMPSGVIQSYCRFFEHAELCGCWPRQLAVGHVWSSILLAIEEANECAIPQAGVVCDIEKAFNCLSRTVVFAIATLLQMPMNVLTGWAGMLTQVSSIADWQGPWMQSPPLV
ncbi:unnamed protein product [Cladocopium goreaui]|uniref:Uncharacterized protein n=1 Tax=Cladocopium goreaui TaxID=2562237 RepID=A0A9P1DKW8_9DINO|nr:unnamed protein product [Cladocopium goreaui]